MSEDLSEYIKKWMLKAEHDLIGAQTIIEHSPLVLDLACFHCQQAVEKYLKAFILFTGGQITKTHDVDVLMLQCSEIDPDFKAIDLQNLALYAVDVRYPDNFLMPEIHEAKQYLQIAEAIKKLVIGKVKL